MFANPSRVPRMWGPSPNFRPGDWAVEQRVMNINGAAGVLASALAVASSIAFGIGVTLVIGSVCYLLLAPAALVIGFGTRRPAAVAAPRPA